MKKLQLICASAIVLTLAGSCSDGNEKAVRDFATDFATKVQNHQTDSLAAIYPGIEAADSIALTLVADSITVTPPLKILETFQIHSKPASWNRRI